jgi:hypothetical protein
VLVDLRATNAGNTLRTSPSRDAGPSAAPVQQRMNFRISKYTEIETAIDALIEE